MAPMASSAGSIPTLVGRCAPLRRSTRRPGDGHDLEVGLDLDHLRRAREVGQECMRHEAGLQIPGQGGQLERGHDRSVVRTFGGKGPRQELRPDAAALHGRVDEEVGQLADAVTQDRTGVADDTLGVIDGNPCVIGRGREVLEEGLAGAATLPRGPRRPRGRPHRATRAVGRPRRTSRGRRRTWPACRSGPRVDSGWPSAESAVSGRGCHQARPPSRGTNRQALRYVDLIGGGPPAVAYTRS